MAVSNLPTFTQNVSNFNVSLTGTNVDTLGTNTYGASFTDSSNVNGARVTSLLLSTNVSSGNVIIYVYLVVISTVYPIGSISLPNGTGNAGTAALDALNPTNMPGLPVDNNGKPFIHLASNATLGITIGTSVASNKVFGTATIENY
jgi:hypothetical protein